MSILNDFVMNGELTAHAQCDAMWLGGMGDQSY